MIGTPRGCLERHPPQEGSGSRKSGFLNKVWQFYLVMRTGLYDSGSIVCPRKLSPGKNHTGLFLPAWNPRFDTYFFSGHFFLGRGFPRAVFFARNRRLEDRRISP